MEVRYRPEELTSPEERGIRERKVIMIDQTLLPPAEFKTIELRTVDGGVAEAIVTMKVRGAPPAIGAAAAFGLALYADTTKARTKDEFMDGFYSAYERLKNTRPTAVNLFWALNRIKRLVEENLESPLEEIKGGLIVEEARRIADEDVEANLRWATTAPRPCPRGTSSPTATPEAWRRFSSERSARSSG